MACLIVILWVYVVCVRIVKIAQFSFSLSVCMGQALSQDKCIFSINYF